MGSSSKPYFISWSEQSAPERLEIQSAQGAEFVTVDGKRVFDAISTSFQACLGHSHEFVLQRIKEEMSVDTIAFPKAMTTLKESVSKKLLQYLDCGPGKIFYTVSGGEAIENALKISRQIRKAKIVLARQKSYHGASLGALSVTGDWRNQAHETVDEWTLRIPEPEDDPDLERTRELIIKQDPETIAAFCLETITGANGVIIPEQSWYEGIQALCDEFGIHLILDEVLCGFARTGKNFAFHHYSCKPDMVVMSKAMSAGVIPLGGVWVKERLAEYYNSNTLACGLTNYAHPLALAALDAVLDCLLKNETKSNLRELQKLFANELSKLNQESYVLKIRSIGLLAAIVLKEKNKVKWSDFVEAGVHLFCKDDTIILAPPYVMEENQLLKVFSIIQETLESRFVA